MKEVLRSMPAVNSALPAEVRVCKLLPCGAQGVVYEGTVDGKAAAVKLYYPEQTLVRVEREIAALGKLTSPSIARLLWSGQIIIGGQSVRVVATSFIDGSPLGELLGQRALTTEEIGALLYDVSDAVRDLWSIRVVHRDLKPSNIMIASGRAVVIDLGVARHIDQATLTAAGLTWGSLGYMSPEQARTVKQLTCKSDLFALGVVALESCLRQHPTARDQQRLLQVNFSETLPGAAERLPMAPLLKRLLLPRPTGRPNPESVIAELSVFARR